MIDNHHATRWERMKAIRFEEYGDYDKLCLVDVPDPPRPDDRHVLVEMIAAGVNPLDNGVRLGWIPFAKPPPLVPGIEGVGRVLDAGRSGLPEGARVMFTGRFGVFHDGTWQQRVWVPNDHAVVVPEAITAEQAAAVPVAYQTAQQALTAGSFRVGQVVLVPAVGSAVGNAGVQLARAQGAAMVITTAGSTAKAEEARRLGYDTVIDLSKEELRSGLQRLAGKSGIDLVIDPLGGEITRAALAGLGRNGTLVLVGLMAGMSATIDLGDVMENRKRLIGWQFFHVLEESPKSFADAWSQIIPLLATGKVSPLVARVFPFTQAAEAQRFQAEGRPFGKVVLRFGV